MATPATAGQSAVSVDRSNKDNWPDWVKSLDNTKDRDRSAYNVWTDVDSVQYQGVARCKNCASKGRECVARPSGSAKMNKCAHCCKVGKICSFQPIKGVNGRELPDKFYCEKPQSCPEIGCQNTKVFKPKEFTAHMKAEHGDPKNIKCTEHKVCQAKEPKKLYNAFTLSHHIADYKQQAKIRDNKQPCNHSDCRGLTKQYTSKMLKHHKRMNHGEAKKLQCSYHDFCKKRHPPILYNTYSLHRHRKHGERRLKEIQNATRCTHSDCSEDVTLRPRTEMEHHWKAEHGEKKGLWCTKHLSCKHQAKQYNRYTYDLHMKIKEYSSWRRSSDSARKCTHPKCVRSPRKLTQIQMQKHWKTSHGGPATSCEVHDRCRDSPRKYTKHTLPIHIASVRRQERSKKQGPWLKCSSPICVDNTRKYHPMALVDHQRRHDNQKIYECKEKECEDSDKLYDKKTFQEHQFQHDMRNRGCVSCDHDDCVGSPLWFEEAMLLVHQQEYHQVKRSERCSHVDCHESEYVYNLWTMIEHRSCHQAPVSPLVEFEDEDEDEGEEPSRVVVEVENDSQDDLDLDALDLDEQDEQDEQGNPDQASWDSDSEAFGQSVKDGGSIAHDDNRASPNIKIDESPRALETILVAASEKKPAHWRIRKIPCPVMGCSFNRPDGLSVGSLLEHVKIIHGLLPDDPRLRMNRKAWCKFPGCKLNKRLLPVALEEHVRATHNGSNATLCVHVDCKNNQRRYTPEQARIHMRSVHAPKTVKCYFPGCEASEVKYDRSMLKEHHSSCHVNLPCLKQDCVVRVGRSWRSLQEHLFRTHDIQVTREHVRAAASGSVNIEFHTDSNSVVQTVPRNELTVVGQLGSGDDHHIGYEEKEDRCRSEDGSCSMDERVEDSDDNVSVEDSDDSDDSISVEDSDIDDSGDEAESAPGPVAETVNRRHEIEIILRCAISSEYSADVRSIIKERNLQQMNEWGLQLSSCQAPAVCCGSRSLRYCDFLCPSQESLSLETAVVRRIPALRSDGCLEWQLRLSARCWRCKHLVGNLERLRSEGLLPADVSQVTECAREACSEASWVGTIYCSTHLMSASNLGRGTGKTLLKRLHHRRCVWKASHTKKFPDGCLPTGSDIDEPADMLEFFKYCELDWVTPDTEDFLGSILDRDGNIRLVDTEFAGQFLVQISIRNARGELLLRRTVDHEMTVQELYERAAQIDGPINLVFGVLNKFYGPPSQKSTRDCGNASTLVNIFKEIAQKNPFQPQHKLLEWSTSRCDYQYTNAAAEKVGYMYLMPPCINSVLCIRPLRKAMPGLFSFSLPILFYLIDPKSRLAFDAHDSEEDTMMLFIVLVIFALKISGREDEFLSWWERDRDLPEGWTAGFIADWMKKPIQARPSISPLNLPAASSRKRTLESAENSKASKKAKFQSDKPKPQPKKAGTQPGKSKTPTTKSVSRRRPRKSPPNSLTKQKKQDQIVVQDPSPDQQDASLPTARQSSRTKGKSPQYREGSNEDDSNDSVFTGDEADDGST